MRPPACSPNALLITDMCWINTGGEAPVDAAHAGQVKLKPRVFGFRFG